MLLTQLVVDAADDIHDGRHNGAQQIQRPLLQRLTHDGMVGIGEGLAGNLKGLLEAHALVHQQTDQLGDGHGGMGIVELHRVVLMEMAQIVAMDGLMDTNHVLQ